MDVIVDKLALVPLFANLGHAELKQIARVCDRQFVAPGHALVEAGTAPDAAYLCLDESIVRETVVAGETRRDPVPAGATLVELAMIVEAEACDRFVATDHARVIRICRDKLTALLEADSALAAVLGDALTQCLAAMANSMREAALPFFVPAPAGALVTRDRDDAEAAATGMAADPVTQTASVADVVDGNEAPADVTTDVRLSA